MQNELTILKNYEFLEDSDITEINELWEGIYEVTASGHIFIVFDKVNEDNLLNAYRQASIEAAKLDIPKMYQDFFNFNEYAEYTWQSVYDVYESVNEIEYTNNDTTNTFYICYI